MPGKRKICVVVTARPSYSRIRTALLALKQQSDVELQVVAAASLLLDRYGNAIRHIEQDYIEINAKVYMVLEGENLITSAKTTGLGLVELATVFDNLKPDFVVTIADRYETIATAIAAAYMNITLVHIQGGEVTGSIDEKVRHAITKLSDYHFVATEKAEERVIRMGEDPSRVFVTGCPSIDLAAEVVHDPGPEIDPFLKFGGVGSQVDISKGYLVVMQHPVTTEYERSRKYVTEALYAIRDSGMPTLWFWPNVDAGSDGTSKGIRAFREIEQPTNIHFFKDIPPLDFLRLVYHSRCIIGNSSVAIRECSFMGVPAVNVGGRQARRERGPNVIDVGYDRREIMEAIRSSIDNHRPEGVTLYGDGHAGDRIADLLKTIPLHIEKYLTY
jgi:UDP-hydrolysing UDP-N-acetyl-D-glucosamine 2-epimerase